MLMLTTLFLGVSQSLPKTSNIKMIEYWLICNLLIVFVEFLIQTYLVKYFNCLTGCYQCYFKETLENELTNTSNCAMKHNVICPDNYLNDDERCQKLMKKIKKKHSFWKCFVVIVVPTIAIFFMILYWVIGLIFYYQIDIL